MRDGVVVVGYSNVRFIQNLKDVIAKSFISYSRLSIGVESDFSCRLNISFYVNGSKNS